MVVADFQAERTYVLDAGRQFRRATRLERARLRQGSSAKTDRPFRFAPSGVVIPFPRPADAKFAPSNRGRPPLTVRLPAIHLPQLPGRLTTAVISAGVLIICGVGAGGLYAHSALESAPVVPVGHIFLAKGGERIGSYGDVAEAPVQLNELPKHVYQAVLAVEDRRYEKRVLPIDISGMARAAWKDFRCRCFAEGGSTIAQQLAKQRLHDSSPTLGRKWRELVVAAYLQAQLGKTKLLADYLNRVPYGHGFVGLRAAARGFFGKEPKELTLGEAAELAGLLRAPSKLNPAADPEASWRRGQLVLQLMVREGYISAQGAAAEPAPQLRLQEQPTRGYLIDSLESSLRKASTQSNAHTYATTIDISLQTAAENAVAASSAKALQQNAQQVAVVVLRRDGSVVALVGGRSYGQSKFNRAVDARRPIGSEAKTPIYVAALRAGYRPDDLIKDAPVSIGGWSPKNFERSYNGSVTLREAFARSLNAATVRLAVQVGLDRVIEVEKRAGITGPLDPRQPAFLLGSMALSPLQMASVFSNLTQCGPIEPHILATQTGAVREACSPMLESASRVQLSEMLHAVLKTGTGRAAAFPGDDNCGGKTGTTSDRRDSWFVGKCGDLVAAVWVGNDDDSPTRTEGGDLPAAIWRNFMIAALNQGPVSNRQVRGSSVGTQLSPNRPHS